MRTIDCILSDWKVVRGTLKQGKSCEYFQMDWKNELENFSALINTLLDEGYTKDDLINSSGKANPIVRMKVVNEMVYSGDGTKFTKAQLIKCKDERAAKWELALKVAFPGKISAPSVTKTPAGPAKTPKGPKIEPKGLPPAPVALVMDTSGLPEIEPDYEFLAQLAALDALVDKK